jgi:hypothetical protein
MGLAEGIRKHGFRKWYERELISSHAHLLLTLLCAIGLFATFELYSRFASASEQLTDFGAVLLLSIVGVWSLRRYLYLLMHAETTANQAVCPECKTYGRFELAGEEEPEHAVRVRCRHCKHEWPIEG